MTTEKVSAQVLAEAHESADELKRRFDGISVDWFLQHLVALANEGDGFRIQLTLNLSGLTISGVLIGGKKYFELFAEQFVNGWEEGEVKQSWQEGFANMGAEMYTEDPPLFPPNFIHLMDAKAHHPSGNLPTETGVLWRGKINAVSGFWLGQLVSGDVGVDA